MSDQYELPNTFFSIFDFSDLFEIDGKRETRFYAERTNFRGVSSNMELFGEYF